MRIKQWMMLLALAVLVMASAAVASAQGPSGQGQPPQGQPFQGQQQGQPRDQQSQGQPPQAQLGQGDYAGVVQSVTSSSVTVLRSTNDTFTAVISSTTRIELMLTQTTGSISDILVGNNVSVEGRKASDGSIVANRIMVEPSGTRVFGSVSVISGSTITLANQNQTSMTVTTTSAKFYKGASAASLSDVMTGAMLTVYGSKQSDGSISATYVIINGGNAPAQGQPRNDPAQTPRAAQTSQAHTTPNATPQPRPTQAQQSDVPCAQINWNGTVQTVDSSSITVLRANNTTFTATISDTTKIELAINQATGTISNIAAGNNVTIEGRQVTTSTVNATRIIVEPSGTKVNGSVTAISGATITLNNPQSTVTIVTTSNTQFITDQATGSLSDVATGEMITVYGAKQSDGSISATYVLINTNGQMRAPQFDQRVDPTTPQDQNTTPAQNQNLFEQFFNWLANRFR